jgi:hypothetical protein
MSKAERDENPGRWVRIIERGWLTTLEMSGWAGEGEPPVVVQLYLGSGDVRALGHLLLGAADRCDRPGLGEHDVRLEWPLDAAELQSIIEAGRERKAANEGSDQ